MTSTGHETSDGAGSCSRQWYIAGRQRRTHVLIGFLILVLLIVDSGVRLELCLLLLCSSRRHDGIWMLLGDVALVYVTQGIE